MLKLRRSAQHTVKPTQKSLLAYARQLVLEEGMEEGGKSGCNTHIWALKKRDYTKNSVSVVVIWES